MYTNKDIADKFGISREAARQWANYFEKYLSPSATPPKGRQRNYVDSDLEVFALVAEMKAQGAKSEEITLALESGQRGRVPTIAPIVPRSDAGINAVRQELALARLDAENLRVEMLKLQGQNELLLKQLDQREQRIEDLYRQLARLEAGR